MGATVAAMGEIPRRYAPRDDTRPSAACHLVTSLETLDGSKYESGHRCS
jgi:hypothetical protein